MDSLITAAARALAAGDPLGALKRVALRDDAAGAGAARHRHGAARRSRARASRCCARGARLRPDEKRRARPLRRRRGRDRAGLARPRLAGARRSTPRGRRSKRMATARMPRMRGYLEVRRLLLIGRLDEAERTLAELDPAPFPPASRAAHELVVAGIAMRRLRTRAGARGARPRRARRAARPAFPALIAEVESARRVLDTPAARLIARGEERPLLLDEVEALLASTALVVDACRSVVRARRDRGISLATRPVLFALARALAEAWPGDVVARRAASRARFGAQACRRIASRAAARRDRPAARGCSRPLADVQRDDAGLRAGAAPRARGRRAGAAGRGASMRRCSPSSPTANPGRARRWRSRSAPASAPCSGRSTSWPRRARCSRSAAARARRWMTPPLPGFTTTLVTPRAAAER